MVGIFSKFSVSRSGHRRTQGALEKEVVPPDADTDAAANVTASAASHGIDVVPEFKPVEHPIEPLDSDEPVHCPPPEPSILNDGRIWKERVSAAGVRRRGSMRQAQPPSSRRMILPSQSAPEHDLLNMLDEFNTSSN